MNPRVFLVIGLALIAGAASDVRASEAITTTAPPQADSTFVPARGSNANRISERDYPFWSGLFNQQGETQVMVLIRQDGTIGEASIHLSSGYGGLDNAAVKIVKERFRYTPATRNGMPVEWRARVRVVWQLYSAGGKENLFSAKYFRAPADPLPAGWWRPDPVNRISALDYPGSFGRLPAAVTLRVRVRADGSVAQVSVVGTSGSDRLDRAAAAMVANRFRYPPQAEEAEISETIRYAREDQPYPLPLPPVCHDEPHTQPASAAGFARSDRAEQILINQDGTVAKSLAWQGEWAGSTLAGDFNREYRFFPPRKNGVPAKCWFDLNMPL